MSDTLRDQAEALARAEMGEPRWMIRFDLGDSQPIYAGITHDRAWGWAPTPATAETFVSEEAASRALENAYGPSMRSVASVVRVAS